MTNTLRAALLAGSITLVAPADLAAQEAKKLDAALAEYVARPDASYRWVKRHAGQIGKTRYAELTLTSQTWRDVAWKHQLFVIRPSTAGDDVKHAILFISGGSWRAEYERPADPAALPREAAILAAAAEQFAVPIAVLLQVPHQPSLGGRFEDDLIAETFVHFMRTGDTDWPLLLPMVKSAVKGMDAASEFAKQEWSLELKSFTVTGASKRGWTTWLTGAVEPRAVAIAPMVIDMLNLPAQMEHQLASWGSYSEQIADYTRRGLQQQLDTPRGRTLGALVDPYSYRERITQPKLIMLGTNDRYWPLDALNVYWDGLVGEKYILYVPNNGHGLTDLVRVTGTLNALNRRAISGKPLPALTWRVEPNGVKLELELKSDRAPELVSAWIAHSDTKDFRSARWQSHTVPRNGEAYVHRVDIPARGYVAMFGEAMFNGEPLPYFLSTNVRIAGNGAAE
jgi:PhoPQ-activated pathogenicity-related protein